MYGEAFKKSKLVAWYDLGWFLLAKGPLPLGIAAVGDNAEEIEIIEL